MDRLFAFVSGCGFFYLSHAHTPWWAIPAVLQFAWAAFLPAVGLRESIRREVEREHDEREEQIRRAWRHARNLQRSAN